MTEVEIVETPVEGGVVDLANTPAIVLACERCDAPALLRPGGICAGCIAAIGLADDQAEYAAWRGRVEEEIAAGPGGAR